MLTKERAIKLLRSLYFEISAKGRPDTAEALISAITALEEHPAIYNEKQIIQKLKEAAILPAADDEAFVILDDAIRIVESAGAEKQEAI